MAVEVAAHRFTSAEYARVVASGGLEGVRVELLDGRMVDLSPQSPEHVEVLRRLMALCTGRMDLLRVQMPLATAEGWEPEPDVALAEPVPGRHPATAHFVAEVAVSSHAVDRSKAATYAAAGVPTYWLVDVPGEVVIVHTRPGPDGFASEVERRGDDRIAVDVDGVEATTVAALLGA